MKKSLLIFLFSSFVLQAQNFADYVRPLVGTGGHGHTYPGATVPFGMVQLSPDTRVDDSWDGCGGYYYSDKMIYGFSHTHLSGTGVSDYGDIMLMPVTHQGSAFSQGDYASKYSHDEEVAQAGFYSVHLKGNNVTANLTSTARTGFHQYIYHESDKAMVVLNLNHRDKLLEGEIEIVNDHTVQGYRYSSAWATNQKIFYYIEFSRKIKSAPGLDDDQKLRSFTKINGQKLCANFFFDVKVNDTLLVKVGISGTSTEGAKLNLQSENPGWNFENIKKKAKETWNKELGKIEIFCEKKSDYETFYTALYHTMIVPNVWNDVDGKYRGRDDQIHTKTSGNYYTVFSLWDTFRAAHPLYTLIDQTRTKDFVETFMLQYDQSGKFPVWELSSNETDCMIGIHSLSVIADAISKGLVDAKYKSALGDAVVKIAGYDYRGMPTMGMNQYLNTEDENESVSKTLEYCYQYYCMGKICRWAGRESDAMKFEWISLGYKNLYNPEAGFFVPRVNGGWQKDFDPRQVNNNFTEANGWQYAFFVPHDIAGMVDMYGGKEKFHAKLDSLFGTSSVMTGREQADITGLIGQYAHGNEPSHHVAYLYNYIGDFKKTNELVTKICSEFYSPQPDGLSGNEDCGQMSAWYVLSAMGLYQVDPGSPYFTITAPQVLSANIHLENGKLLSIQRDKGMINSISWNGVPLNQLYLSYDELMNGGLLKFETGNTNSLAGNIKEGDILKTSAVTAPKYIAAPVIKIYDQPFIKDTWIEIQSADPKLYTTYYSIEDTKGKITKKKYSKKFKVKANCKIVAYTQFGLGGVKSPTSTAHCYKKPNDYLITIESKPHEQYFPGGAEALLDGIHGDLDWRKGNWHGYQGQDFVAIIDLRKSTKLTEISCTFLQDPRAWIIFPTKVEFWVSTNGINYDMISANEEVPDTKNEKVEIKTMSFNRGLAEYRYIKIIAKSFGPLPKGHVSEGEPSYIFIDEISFK
jgi:predicted alpha-1,2-mannosidase